MFEDMEEYRWQFVFLTGGPSSESLSVSEGEHCQEGDVPGALCWLSVRVALLA